MLLTWKNTLNTNLGNYGHFNKAADFAKRTGYVAMAWNDRIWVWSNPEKTNMIETKFTTAHLDAGPVSYSELETFILEVHITVAKDSRTRLEMSEEVSELLDELQDVEKLSIFQRAPYVEAKDRVIRR